MSTDSCLLKVFFTDWVDPRIDLTILITRAIYSMVLQLAAAEKKAHKQGWKPKLKPKPENPILKKNFKPKLKLTPTQPKFLKPKLEPKPFFLETSKPKLKLKSVQNFLRF